MLFKCKGLDIWHSFSEGKLYILTLIDEHEREETRQLYEELNNNVEVSDVACKKADVIWVIWICGAVWVTRISWDPICTENVLYW